MAKWHIEKTDRVTGETIYLSNINHFGFLPFSVFDKYDKRRVFNSKKEATELLKCLSKVCKAVKE